MKYLFPARGLFLLLFLAAPLPVLAGVTNPDISVLGQMRTFVTEDPADENSKRVQMSFDESELVADAALNPYAHGTFVFAVAEGSIEVEEGYFQIVRGLPSGFEIKAGKYRVGFGKLNPVHAHAYPFIERPHVLAAYLPGEEAFNEIGGQLSYRLPLPRDFSSVLSVDALQGQSFHPDETSSRPAIVGRWSNFFLLRDPSSMEIGFSVAHGTNQVEQRTRTTLLGADVKTKWWFNGRDYLIAQAELLTLNREDADTAEAAERARDRIQPVGGYFFTDLFLRRRYDLGFIVERYQRAERDEYGKLPWDHSVGAFVGLALMEETTLFRLVGNRFLPDGVDAFHTVTLQAVFSMGPHKPHQF